MMKLWIGAIALVGSAAMLAGPQHAYAQASATFQTALGNAELAELSAEKRAEVEARMKQPGQTVPEILQTILLNSIKLKYPANRIAALDFGRGIAVVELRAGKCDQSSSTPGRLRLSPESSAAFRPKRLHCVRAVTGPGWI